MIPKKIHYCWFGKTEMPKLGIQCIASWKRFMPDYEIICWNETNYDVSKNPYMFEAYQRKKWGFVPDYARLDIIYRHGGIYLDTDVEIIKSFDFISNIPAFCGFEDNEHVNFGVGFGAEPGFKLLKELLDYYEDLSFYKDGKLNLTPSPVYQTAILLQYGLTRNNQRQKIADMEIFPAYYFSPKSLITQKITITSNTYSIHHFAASWTPCYTRALFALHTIIGHRNYQILKKIISFFLPPRIYKRLSGEE